MLFLRDFRDSASMLGIDRLLPCAKLGASGESRISQRVLGTVMGGYFPKSNHTINTECRNHKFYYTGTLDPLRIIIRGDSSSAPSSSGSGVRV